MEKVLPFVSAIFPLVVTAVASKFPKSNLLAVILASFFLSWITLVVSSRVRLWLKVLILVVYPVVTLPAMWVLMLLVAAPHFH